MKEIKFRAWDKWAERWAEYDDSFSTTSEDYKDTQLYVTNEVSMHDESDERWIFELFTGITDNKGNKIYDGDILRDERGDIFTVVFFEQSASFRPKGEFLSEFHVSYGDGETWIDSRFEVIGNIHENPDLLK